MDTRNKAVRTKAGNTSTAHESPNDRYYFELFRSAQDFCVDLDSREWCDLWHTHFDWKGWGDRSWLDRRRHLTALLRALNRASRELKDSDKPYQLFAVVHPHAAGQDAIYVHTENPNGTAFPCVLRGYVLQRLPPLLAGRISLDDYQVLANLNGDETTYLIQALPLVAATRQELNTDV